MPAVSWGCRKDKTALAYMTTLARQVSPLLGTHGVVSTMHPPNKTKSGSLARLISGRAPPEEWLAFLGSFPFLPQLRGCFSQETPWTAASAWARQVRWPRAGLQRALPGTCTSRGAPTYAFAFSRLFASQPTNSPLETQAGGYAGWSPCEGQMPAWRSNPGYPMQCSVSPTCSSFTTTCQVICSERYAIR